MLDATDIYFIPRREDQPSTNFWQHHTQAQRCAELKSNLSDEFTGKMSSSPRSFRESSPAGAPGRTRSQFTYRHLNTLASYSTSCPLRVIAHIDLDAFYAQCEMRRLDIPDDQPLAVQQWQGLIAVNYPARDRGVGRFTDITQAKELCDNLICQHVATWREGEDNWAYRDDHVMNTDKVSLDP